MRNKLVLTFSAAVFLAACATDEQATTNSNTRDEVVYTSASSEQKIEEVLVTGRRRAELDQSASVEMREYEFVSQDQDQLVKQRAVQSMYVPQSISQTLQSNENYSDLEENDIQQVATDPVSTFSIDVDTASYSNIRRMITGQGYLPPKDAVKIEEMVNYFSYDYPSSDNPDQPFSVHTELAPVPWVEGGNDDNKLLMQIGLKGYEPDLAERPAANLVFLVDVSGSMQSEDKLPLLKKSLRLLVNQMNDDDRIALAVYAGSAGLVLESTPASEKRKILNAIDNLTSGGSTNGSAGIHLAYQVAEENLIEGGINRILIASDGDMNVGVNGVDAFKELMEEKRKTGIAITTLGFGTGNYNDAMMEQIADVGNGNAAYIDSLLEAQKVLVNEMQSTLLTIAKDVKIQVEFNPELVAEYRLIGYENRILEREDFRNDRVDAGEIGAGHTVTALYEVTLKGSDDIMIPELRYQQQTDNVNELRDMELSELAYVNLRYKLPEESVSTEFGQPVHLSSAKASFDQSSDNLQFAASVASFGHLLRNSDYTQGMSFDQVLKIARDSKGKDEHGYRSEFLSLVELAKSLSAERVVSQL